MSFLSTLKDIQVSKRMAAISIAVLLVVIALVIAKMKVGGSAASNAEVQRPAASARVTQTQAPKSAEKSGLSKSQPAKADDPYKLIAERNIFQPIPGYTPTAASANQTGTRQTGALPPLNPFAALMGGGSSPFGGRTSSGGRSSSSTYAFTGLVDTPDGTMALIENTSTGEGTYAAIGDQAFGMDVIDINPRSITLDSDGRSIRLTLGENKREAAVAQPGQPNTAGGAQQVQPGQPNTAGAAGMADFMRTLRTGRGSRGFQQPGTQQGGSDQGGSRVDPNRPQPPNAPPP